MNELNPALSFKQAADVDNKLDIPTDILAWFKARGTGWQNELNGYGDNRRYCQDYASGSILRHGKLAKLLITST